MRTLETILAEGIKDEDWTYCKKEYAPYEECKVGMPPECTPDGATRMEVETCYIVTGKFVSGEVSTHEGMMYLSDGRFYWYENLWEDDEIVDDEKQDGWFIEPIAWIPYRNIPDVYISLPNAPCKADAVPRPKGANNE